MPSAYVSLGLSVIVALLAGSFAIAEEKAPDARTELKAVAFGLDEAANNEKLEKLTADGWEYVGPLNVGMVAFRRAGQHADDGDVAKLAGVWINVYTEQDGVRRTPNSRHVFVGNRYFRLEEDVIAEDGVFVTDTSGPVKKIDFRCIRGEDEGHTWHAIYELDGDTYRHFGPWGTDNWDNRPAEFAEKTDANTFLRVMKRERNPSPAAAGKKKSCSPGPATRCHASQSSAYRILSTSRTEKVVGSSE